MEILNYEQIILDNRDNLINSFVEQYGEENRQVIEQRFDETRFCIFQNPRRLLEYIKMESQKIGKELTLEFFNEIEINGVRIDSNGNLVIEDDNLKKFVFALFPDTGYLSDDNIDKGIFSFLNSDDSKIKFLQSLSLIKENDNTFLNSDDYEQTIRIINSILQVALKYREKYESSLLNIKQYYKDMLEKEKMICKKHEIKYLLACQTIVSKYNSLKKLQNPSFFYSEMSSKKYPFEIGSGLLESFLPCEDMSKREEILEKRLKYLRVIGIDANKLVTSTSELGTLDWYQIPELCSLIPSIEVIKQIKELREQHEKDCMVELANFYVLNNYSLSASDLNNSTIRDIVFLGDSKYTCQFRTKQGHSDATTIYLCPMDAGSDVLDVTLDHELRHAIEYSTKIVTLEEDSGPIKSGTKIEKIKSGINLSLYLEDELLGESNRNINEIMTQKMSLESTKARYEKGIYILTSPESARVINTSDYDRFIPNFDLAFPPEIQRIMIKSRMQTEDEFSLYSYVPQETLTLINNLIIDSKEESLRHLRSIGFELSNVQISSDKNK